MIRILTIGALLWIVASGCDQGAPAPAPPASATTNPARDRVGVRVVTTLTAGLPTHLARSGDGTLWWVQESDEGHDVAFAMAADGVPRASPLTAARVLEAMELPQGPKTRGNLHSLAAGRDGSVWFYFSGAAGRRSVACVGRFDPRDGAVRIVVTPAQVEESTAMGASLVLARGTILAVGRGEEMWLWLRHSDGARVLRIDPASGKYWRAFEGVTTESGRPLSLTGSSLRAGAGKDGILLLDPASVELWRIDAAGRAKSLHDLIGLPAALSCPAADATGRTYVFAPDAPLIPARTDAEAEQILPVRYPALLIVESGKLRSIGRDRIDAPGGLSLQSIRVQELLVEPDAPSLIGFDEQSGALLRFQIVTGP